MASGERVRIEIAFDGGQIVGALVPADAAEQLERALATYRSVGATRYVREIEALLGGAAAAPARARR